MQPVVCVCTDLMRHLLQTIQRTNVIQRVYGWRETTVQAEDLTERELYELSAAVSRSQRRDVGSGVMVIMCVCQKQRMPHLPIHQGCEWEVVKEVCEVLPDVCVAVFPQALVIETVHLCDLPALVVSSQYRDAFWIANLQTQ